MTFLAVCQYHQCDFQLPNPPPPEVTQCEERQVEPWPNAPTRSTTSAERLHAAPRPTSLPVSSVPSQPILIQAAEEEEPDWFPDGQEERTPGGVTQELVGHPCKVTRLKNAQMVTPDLTSPPLNVVGGISLNLLTSSKTLF